jgi:peroxiredoxin
MAQLRQDYEEFTARSAEVVVVGPDSQSAFKDFWQSERIPFVGLADPKHTVARRYGQEVKLLKFGRMPAMMVIDKAGAVRYKHYGAAMSDIPASWKILDVLDALNQEEAQRQ